ncbi:MAG: DUF1552 domain-containing protein [Myxococcota bacterium]
MGTTQRGGTMRAGRRRFLKGSAGAMLGLPALASLGSRSAKAAGGPECRLVVVSMTQGYLVDEMATAGATEQEFVLGPQLEPLAAHRDAMLLVRGVHDDSCALDSYNAHTTNRVHALTGRGMIWQPGAEGLSPVSAGGISIDQRVAELWADTHGPTPYRSLEFGVRAKGQTMQSVSWADAGQPLPPDNDPSNMFARLFSDFETPDPAVFERQKANRGLVLDAVKENFDAVRGELSTADKAVLDLHAEKVTSLQTTIESLSFCTPPAAPGNAASAADEATLQAQLLATAFECGLTRTATMVIGEMSWSEYGIDYTADSYHNVVHTGPTTPERRSALRDSYRWNYTQLATLLDLLATTSDGQGGNLLDTTVVLVANDFSTGASHSYKDKDFLLFGGADTGLNTGRMFDAGGRTSNDLYTGVMEVLGLDDGCFGDPEFCSGALGGLT